MTATVIVPPDVVDALLRIEGQTLVQKVDWFAELGSTNDAALKIAEEDRLELPRLIWTDQQTSGRGRGAHHWWAAPGALTVSLIVDERTTGLRTDQWPQVSVVTGLAVADALRQFVPAPAIGLKWPNDVQLHGRKVCGILVEVPRSRPDRLVIGVGINVGNSFRHAPPELQTVATALVDLLKEPPSRTAVLLAWLTAWQRLTSELKQGAFDLPRAWRALCVLQDAPIRVTAGNTITDGVFRGIDQDGGFWLDTPQGRQKHVAGTVRRLD